MGQLTYTNSDNQEITVQLDASNPDATIGRSQECRISVNFSSISRKHAHVYFDAASGTCTVADLGSANGVMLNGMRVNKESLKNGDEIMLGGFKLRYAEGHVATYDSQSMPPPPGYAPPQDDKTFVFGGPADFPGAGGPGPASGVTPASPQAGWGDPPGPSGSGPAAVPATNQLSPVDQLNQRVKTLEAELEQARQQPGQPAAAQQRITELETVNRNVQQHLQLLQVEADQLRRRSAPEPKQLDGLRQDLRAAHTQVREIDRILTRALHALDSWIAVSSGTPAPSNHEPK